MRSQNFLENYSKIRFVIICALISDKAKFNRIFWKFPGLSFLPIDKARRSFWANQVFSVKN